MKAAVREAARTIQRMGTSIELKVAHTKPESVLDELETQLKGYDHRFSANDPRSELNQLNQLAGQKGLVLDPELYQLIEIGKHHSCILPSVHWSKHGASGLKMPASYQRCRSKNCLR